MEKEEILSQFRREIGKGNPMIRASCTAFQYRTLTKGLITRKVYTFEVEV